jgi:hypothetical protein
MSLAALALGLTFLASAGGDPHAAHREKPQIMAPAIRHWNSMRRRPEAMSCRRWDKPQTDNLSTAAAKR